MKVMEHLTEEQLIEHYYRDDEDRVTVEGHLTVCTSCQESYQSLAHMLEAVSDSPVPERGEGYGREVYARLLPKLEMQKPAPAGFDWRSWFRMPALATAGALASLLLVAFLAGRLLPRSNTPAPTANTAQIRERVLLVAVGDHLDRSQMVLLELSNAPDAGARNDLVDISSEQKWARELVPDNRLYRQTATEVGETGMASVLEELERLLLDVANRPSKISESEFRALRKRIEDKGILFKVRVIGSEVREREERPPVSSADRGKL